MEGTIERKRKCLSLLCEDQSNIIKDLRLLPSWKRELSAVGETVARCKCKTNIGFDPAVPPDSFYRANMTGVSNKKGTAGDKKFTIRHSMKARAQ